MEKPQVRFELDWRATVVSWIFIMAALVLIAGGLYVFASTMVTAQIIYWFVTLILAGGVGWKLRGSRDSVQTSRVNEADVIDVTPSVPQIPEPRFFKTDPNTFTRSTLLDDKARAIAQALRDAGLQPTRQNIKLYGTDINIGGNEAASIVYQRYVRWGWAEPVTQGEPGRWREQDEN